MPQQQLQQQQTESSVQCDRAITVSVQPARAPTCVVFQETKRPSKEMQVTIARQLGLDPSTVSNFFMNARRRSVDKWREDSPPPGPASPGPAPAPRTVYVSGGSLVPVLSPAPLDSGLWQELGVEPGPSPAPAPAPATTVYIIPRSALVPGPDSPEPGDMIGDEVVLHQDTDQDTDMLETDEEVLDDDDCLEPPD